MAKWTEDELAFLRANYGAMRGADIAEKLWRSTKIIQKAAYRLGLSQLKTGKTLEQRRLEKNASDRDYRTRLREHRAPAACLWTEDQERFLRNNWMRMTALDIGFAINRSERSVMSKASVLGLPRKNGNENRDHSKSARRFHPKPAAPTVSTAESISAARADMAKKPGALFFRVMGAW